MIARLRETSATLAALGGGWIKHTEAVAMLRLMGWSADAADTLCNIVRRHDALIDNIERNLP